MAPIDSGLPVSATATHATAAVATITGATGRKTRITDISASSDKAGSIILVKDGTTVIWQDIVGVGNYNHSFKTPLPATVGGNCSVEIDGTAACKANVSGFQA